MKKRVETDIIEDLPRLVTETVEKFGGLDVLVNNAALGTIGCNLENTTAELMDAVLNVNIKAALNQASERQRERRAMSRWADARRLLLADTHGKSPTQHPTGQSFRRY